MTLNDDLNACARIVQRGDPDRFLAAMAAPPAARRILFALYAFNIEVSRAPWITQEPMIAEMRLQWWRDAVGEIARGVPVRRHEVIGALADVLDRCAADDLDQIVAVRRWDVYKEPFEDQAHFDRYMDQSAGTPMWVAARRLGAADETVVRHVGYANGVACWLRAVPELKSLQRIPLLDDSEDAVRALARGALDRLECARQSRTLVSRASAVALNSAWQAGAILRQAVADPAAVAAGTLGQSEARKRLGLMIQSTTGRW